MPETRRIRSAIKNTILVGLAIVLVPVIPVAPAAILGLIIFTRCDDNRLDLPSPNGRWIAHKVDETCPSFLDGTFSTRITVRQAASWAPPFEIFLTGGDTDTRIEWRSEGILDITVDDGFTPSLSLRDAAGVHVRYHVRRSRPPDSEAPYYRRFRQWAKENTEDGEP